VGFGRCQILSAGTALTTATVFGNVLSMQSADAYYKAPEQLHNPLADPATAALGSIPYAPAPVGVWSAGVLLYTMLRSAYPFPQEVPAEQLLTVMHARPLTNTTGTPYLSHEGIPVTPSWPLNLPLRVSETSLVTKLLGWHLYERASCCVSSPGQRQSQRQASVLHAMQLFVGRKAVYFSVCG
jgi:serine/threonine protein kinase